MNFLALEREKSRRTVTIARVFAKWHVAPSTATCGRLGFYLTCSTQRHDVNTDNTVNKWRTHVEGVVPSVDSTDFKLLCRVLPETLARGTVKMQVGQESISIIAAVAHIQEDAFTNHCV